MDAAKYKAAWKKLFENHKNSMLLCLGIAGMALVLVSTYAPARNKENPMTGAGSVDAQSYAVQMEERLQKLLGSIDGVGRCQVMLTMENEAENVYAVEQTQSASENQSYDGSEVKQQNQQQNSAQKYILIDAGGGRKEALLTTRKPPAIQGVAIVCEGGDDQRTRQRVIEAASTLLGVPYNRVCITRIGNK